MKMKNNQTIDQALGFVNRSADSFESWRAKGLGLQLVLMGLAEIQALRMSKLANLVVTLENNLMHKEALRDLKPQQLFSLYRITVEALDNSSTFVERVVKNINWKEMEDQLTEAKVAETQIIDTGLHETADDLLLLLAQAEANSVHNNVSADK